MTLGREVGWTVVSMYDTIRAMSYKRKTRAITVRVQEARLKQIMRYRRIATQSELINTLLAEEAEKIASRSALEATADTADSSDFDDRLL